MSNYPPGVTGQEPEIAGYPETDYSVPECDNEDCDFTGGVVEGQVNNGTFFYTCPECDFDMETEYDNSPDPDDARERAWEEANGL